MSKRLRWRVLLIVLVVVAIVGGYILTGYSRAKKEMGGTGTPPFSEALKKGIKLGLDLRGGIHLVLQVNTVDALKAQRDNDVTQLVNQAREQGVTLGAVEYPNDWSFMLAITPQTDQPKLDEIVKRWLPDWNVNSTAAKWSFSLKDPSRRSIEDSAVTQADRDDPQPRRRVWRRRAFDRARGKRPDPRAVARNRRPQEGQGSDPKHRLSRVEARRPPGRAGPRSRRQGDPSRSI